MMRRLRPLLLLMLAIAAPAIAAGDPVKGSALHGACLGCHGTEVYVAPRAKAKTIAALRKAVVDWNDRMNPKFDNKEIEDVVAYLNRDFYHLKR